jgi:cytidylate kinase
MTAHLCIHGEVFTRTQKIIDWIASRTGWQIVSDHDLIEEAGRRFNLPTERLETLVTQPPRISNRLTRSAEQAMAYLKSVVADKLGKKTTIFHGFIALATTTQLPQVLNVLVTADERFRIRRALHAESVTERQARNIIDRRDHEEFHWCRHAFGKDRILFEDYDLIVPSDRLPIESAGRQVLEQLANIDTAAKDKTVGSIDDLRLASKIQLRLTESGYPVTVAAEMGRIRLTVNRPVVFLKRLAKKMEQEVLRMEGVQEVQTRVGRNFYRADIYRRSRFQLPIQEEFRCFTERRRCLYARAAEDFPLLEKRQERVDQATSVQQLASRISP